MLKTLRRIAQSLNLSFGPLEQKSSAPSPKKKPVPTNWLHVLLGVAILACVVLVPLYWDVIALALLDFLNWLDSLTLLQWLAIIAVFALWRIHKAIESVDTRLLDVEAHLEEIEAHLEEIADNTPMQDEPEVHRSDKATIIIP